MKKINFKIAAFVLGTGLAMVTGFSSFTKAKRDTTYTFAHIAHSTSNLKTDYVFRSDLAGCNESSNICTADWSQSTVPAEGSHPASDAVEVDRSSGDYQGM